MEKKIPSISIHTKNCCFSFSLIMFLSVLMLLVNFFFQLLLLLLCFNNKNDINLWWSRREFTKKEKKELYVHDMYRELDCIYVYMWTTTTTAARRYIYLMFFFFSFKNYSNFEKILAITYIHDVLSIFSFGVFFYSSIFPLSFVIFRSLCPCSGATTWNNI